MSAIGHIKQIKAGQKIPLLIFIINTYKRYCQIIHKQIVFACSIKNPDHFLWSISDQSS